MLAERKFGNSLRSEARSSHCSPPLCALSVGPAGLGQDVAPLLVGSELHLE